VCLGGSDIPRISGIVGQKPAANIGVRESRIEQLDAIGTGWNRAGKDFAMTIGGILEGKSAAPGRTAELSAGTECARPELIRNQRKAQTVC